MDTEVFGEKAQLESKPSEKPERRNLMCAELSFSSKDFVLSLPNQNSDRESALLGPQVKLRINDKSDRCGHASSYCFRSNQSFRTLGSSPINTLPPPSFAVGCSVIIPKRETAESIPRKIPKQNPKPTTESKVLLI